MKTCSCCGVEKPLTEFHRRGTAHQAKCKECVKAWGKSRPRGPSTEEHKAKCRAYYQAHREKMLADAKAYYEANKAAIEAYRAEYEAAHPGLAAARTAEWRKAHPGRDAANTRAYAKANPGKINAAVAKREAQKLQATPAWANAFFIEEIYDLAARRTKLLGVEHHVDHIVPLRSKIVCGLHVETNLRVIPAVENMSKGNRHWPEMPTCETSLGSCF